MSHMATSTQCRIHQLCPVGTASRSASSVPEYLSAELPKRDIGRVARADTAVAHRRRSSWRLCDNQCGEAGQKRTKYATLIRYRAVAARGALRRFALIGRRHISHRTRQTSQPGSGGRLDGFSACEDHQKTSNSQTSHSLENAPVPAATTPSKS